MNSILLQVVMTLLAVVTLSSQTTKQNTNKAPKPSTEPPAVTVAVDKGAKWLASVQGEDGGWGQDGSGTSYVQKGVQSQSKGNDVANTAVAALALLRAGKQYQANVERAMAFILERIEASPTNGLGVTDVQGTQIQMKLGPYIDTFLASMLLAQVDGTLAKSAENARVRRALEKCVAKIERNQKSDGSWNIAGGWAPVLGTSMASRSLFEARKKGITVDGGVMEMAQEYTVKNLPTADVSRAGGSGSFGGVGKGEGSGIGRGAGGSMGASSESAGVPLYQSAQALEQLSRTESERQKNAVQIKAIRGQLANAQFVEGFGSIGGEEFFSYLNISDSMKRAGGEEWKQWHSKITDKILKLQNSDGTWAGHHCITGRVAVTSAAILNLTVDRAN